MAFLIHEKLEAFDAAIEAVRRGRKALIEKTVSECRHPVDDIRELPYRESDYAMHAERPWLICLACGFTEEG